MADRTSCPELPPLRYRRRWHTRLDFPRGQHPVSAGSPLLPAWAFGSTFLVAVVSWLIVAVVLPATRDMSLPSNSRLPLAVGAVWYGVLVGIVFAVLALLLFALFFPG